MKKFGKSVWCGLAAVMAAAGLMMSGCGTRTVYVPAPQPSVTIDERSGERVLDTQLVTNSLGFHWVTTQKYADRVRNVGGQGQIQAPPPPQQYLPQFQPSAWSGVQQEPQQGGLQVQVPQAPTMQQLNGMTPGGSCQGPYYPWEW